MNRREFVAQAAALALSGCANGGMPTPPAPPPTEPIPNEPMANGNLLASDNFASGSLAAGWTATFGYSAPQVVGSGASAVTEPNALSTNAGIVWTGVTFPNDQISEVVLGAGYVAEANTAVDLVVRGQIGGTLSCYLAVIQAGTNNFTISKFVAGVQTAFVQLTLSVAPAAGDIWTFQAQGSCLSVYQNYNRIGYWFDATYASGAPGYLLFSSVNITHSQVSAWRGYGAQQVDGVWTKQGTVIVPNATDLGYSSFPGIHNPSRILYEGNAQLLSGTVYKMWTSAGSGIAYFESLDGRNWTRNASLVITGQFFPGVIKNGSTYYLYSQLSTAQGTSNWSLYTSSNGISWTLVNSNVFAIGTAGQWDAAFVYSFTPVYIDGGGTWWAIYTGGNNASTALGSLGVATSPDGQTWTRYGGNPVVANTWATTPLNIGGTWYLWGASNQPGLTAGSNLDPSDTIRQSSPDLKTWSNKKLSIKHSELSAGVNTPHGQAYADYVMQVGNQTWMYYDVTPHDGGGAGNGWQVNLAIANAPPATLVQFSEDGAAQVASDNFTRANGSLGPNWVTPTGGTALQIVSNIVEPTVTATDCQAIDVSAPFSNDQYAETVITALGASSYNTPLVRASTSALTWYEAAVGGPTGSVFNCFITKRVANVPTTLGPTQTITPQVGDTLRLSAVGNVLSLYQNGFLVLQVQDMNPLVGGNPGFKLYATTAVTNAQVALWDGGNANVSPFAGGGAAGDLGPGYDFKFRL